MYMVSVAFSTTIQIRYLNVVDDEFQKALTNLYSIYENPNKVLVFKISVREISSDIYLQL